MRKFLLSLVAICFLGIGAQAQEMSKGQLVGSARLGLGGGGFPVAVSADYGIVDHLINKKDAISVGGQVGVFIWNDGYESHINFTLTARGNFHYQFIDNLDTYAGLQIGLHTAGLGFGFDLGARYYFNDKFAANIEFGGCGFTGVSAGISMKL